MLKRELVKEKLPRFGSKAECPKCGALEFKALYKPEQTHEMVHYGFGGFQSTELDELIPEYMLRVCLTCDYSWKEACKDA